MTNKYEYTKSGKEKKWHIYAIIWLKENHKRPKNKEKEKSQKKQKRKFD